MPKLSEKTVNYIKLSLTGIILIWLFIRSPFNPLYEDSSPGEMAFVKLNFAYWFLAAVFVLWVLYFIQKSNYDKYAGLILTCSAGLYFSFYIFYGYDVMDSGYTLAKQWAMYNGMWKENLDLIAGTNMIGGFWLSIPGEPFLLWARLGYVLVQAMITFLSYRLLVIFFCPKKIFAPFFFTMIFIAVWHFYKTVNYDNLSFLFFLSSVYFLCMALKSLKESKLFLIISGALIIFAIFCKISYMPALIFPFFLVLLNKEDDEKNSAKKICSYIFVGMAVGSAIIAFILIFTGSFNSYLNNFTIIAAELFEPKDADKFYSHDHSFSRLYGKYRIALIEVFFLIFKYSGVVLIISYLISKAKNNKMALFPVIFFFAVILYYMIIEKNNTGKFFDRTMDNLIGFHLSIIVLWLLFADKTDVKNRVYGVVVSSGLFFFSFLGSDLTFRSGFHASSSLLIIVTALVISAETELKVYGHKLKLRTIYYFLIFSFIINIPLKKDNLYREADFKFLSKSFESRPLSGIKTNPQRADVVDSLVVFLKSVDDLCDKSIFFSHSNPMMYYLTGTNYFLDHPWDVVNEYEILEDKLIEVMPEYFVVSKISHRLGNWPLGGVADQAETNIQKYYDLFENFVDTFEYNEIYSNSFYKVYGIEKAEK